MLGGHGRRRFPHVHARHVLMVRHFLLRPADQTNEKTNYDCSHTTHLKQHTFRNHLAQRVDEITEAEG
jgi:hypothetical protein